MTTIQLKALKQVKKSKRKYKRRTLKHFHQCHNTII